MILLLPLYLPTVLRPPPPMSLAPPQAVGPPACVPELGPLGSGPLTYLTGLPPLFDAKYT